MESRRNFPKNFSIHDKNCEISGLYNFCDAFIICKMNEKTGRMYQKLHIKLQCSLAGPGFRF